MKGGKRRFLQLVRISVGGTAAGSANSESSSTGNPEIVISGLWQSKAKGRMKPCQRITDSGERNGKRKINFVKKKKIFV